MGQPLRLSILIVILTLALVGCFKDASDDNVAPTTVRLNQVQPTSTRPDPSPTTAPLPTIVPAASKTFVDTIGGPSGSSADDEDDSDDTIDETTTTPTPTKTSVPLDEATVAPPSFGDTGISPTPSVTFTPSDVPAGFPTPSPVATQDNCIYLVSGGDTLYSIAREYDLFPEDFYPLNPELQFSADSLYIGQEIRLPNCEPEGDETSTEEAAPVDDQNTPESTLPPGIQVYVVQQGDTLFSIATRFGVSVQDIVDATDFLITQETTLYPGDELVIPAPQE